MKNEPCIRLGIRISPKIREKPDDSRKRRPPSAMLLTAKVSHKLMGARLDPVAADAARRSCHLSHAPACPPVPARRLVSEILGGRIIPRVDRVRQELALVVGPELTDVLVGLEHRVDELAVFPVAAPDE